MLTAYLITIAALILSTIFTPFNITKAADATWTQSDWSVGSGGGHTNTSTEYLSGTNVDTSVANKITLAKSAEKFSGVGIDSASDLNSWMDLPSWISGLKLQLKADSIVGLSDGSIVGTWNDSSGNNNNVTQATAGYEPLYKAAALNGKPTVRFDGGDDVLTGAISGFTTGATIFSAQTIISNKSGGTYEMGNGGVNTGFSLLPWTTTMYSRMESGGSKDITWTFTIPSTMEITQQFDGTNKLHKAWLNGTAKTPIATGTGSFDNSISTINVGALTSSSYYSNTDLAELIIYNTSLSDTDRVSIENYLNKKYSLNSNVSLETTIKRTGSGSAKVIAPVASPLEFTQNINVGDTNKYNLSTYAYIDGSTVVDGTYAQLYSNGSPITTNYADQGGGWYKLTGVITGANASRSYGLQVKANKTIYTDDFSLTNYAPSGSLTSNIYDTTTSSNWGNLAFTSTGTTSIKVRTAEASDPTMSSAKAFSDGSCTAITSSGTDIPNNDCSTDIDRYVQYQITLSTADTSTSPEFQSISITYSPSDTGNPNNPASLASSESQKTGGTDIIANTWYGFASPYFTWNEPTDPPDGNGISTGIAGYYIYFGASSTGDPYQARGVATELGETGKHYQAGRTFEIGVDTAAMTSGQTYYLRIETKDNAGNIAHIAAQDPSLFTYQYDGDKPTNPHYVSASPSGYSSTKDFSFIWPTANAAAATDTGGSGLNGYQYKINDDATWYGPNHTGVITDVIPYGTGTIALPVADQGLVVEGTNSFYLRTLDIAGNIAISTIQVPFYFNSSAPTAPTGLYVDPGTNTANSFAFGWIAPGNPVSPIVGYYYAVNPTWPLTVAKVSYTTENTLPAGAYATQQGNNYFYVVAKDEAGNANLSSCENIQNNPLTDGCAKVTFIANTPAPGIPTGVIVNDQSIRAVAYKASLSWSAPEQVGIGIDHYNIYRKSGSGDYAEIASPTDRYYLDEGVQAGTLYYYVVRAVDSAQKESANSSVATITPRGKYESPALIVDGSIKVENTSRTAIISWQTETNRDPYTNEIHTTDSMVAYGKTTNLESTAADRDFSSNHVINLTNLEPDTIYYYQVLGVDENGNRTEGNVLTFQTEKPTIISNVEVLDIRQTTAILKWETNRITTTELLYGKSTTYGSTYKEGDTPNATTHTVFLKDLESGTQYHFQIQGQDEFGDIIKSDDYTILKTLDFPKIENITFQPLKDEAITTVEVAWTTNIPTDGRVKYASTDGSNLREEYDGEFKKDHKFKIGEGKLLDQKTYIFKAFVRDQYGSEATSDNQSYTTPEDTRAPLVTNLQSEVLIEGSGDAAKVSAVITWDTDEVADSQVFYGAGTAGDYANSTGKDNTLVTAHLVVISDLKPGSTYHVKAASSDKSGNLSQSGAQNFVTNQASQSVVNIILTRLQQVFGWMTSINGLFGG